MDSFSLTPGPVGRFYEETQNRLSRLHFTSSLWARQLSLWTADSAIQQKIGHRLGWLSALDFVAPHLDRLRGVADEVRAAGITDIVLLGMGGSSLAPEVMRQILGVAPGFPRFRMLDSVDPDAVDAALSRVEHTLFVFASKSGGTIEPNAMAAEAARRLERAGVTPWGSRFIAITDEGTALHTRAVAERFRHVFVNPSDIGGRYSALSFFGLVPAALMGADLDELLRRARTMAEACRREGADNPGVALGAFMAAAALAGRDKLTLIVPPQFESFGLWVEQLVAESTGKERQDAAAGAGGVGIVPIAGEPADAHLGGDRVIVVMHVGDASPDQERLAAARQSGAPVADIRIPDARSLGAEFFRWEIATATAGFLLDVNPFDEPNVQQAKDATNQLLADYSRTGEVSAPAADLAEGGMVFTLSEAARRLNMAPPRLLESAREGDYVSVMAFLPPDAADLGHALTELRHRVSRKTHRPTMFGYGPRYLHSTGQLHKGGPNSGLFVVIAAPSPLDFPVPGAGYSFGVLEQAQAIGDFRSLDRTGRRALLVRLGERSPEAILALADALTR